MRHGYTALLPVGKCFHNKVKLNLAEVYGIWGASTVQLMDRTKPDGKTTIVFVVGSGAWGGYDTHLSVRHDQTFAYLGEYRQFGEILIDEHGKITKQLVDEGREIPKSAPVHVYK